MVKTLLLILGLGLVTMGCTTAASTVGVTPAQKLLGLKADYEAVIRLANAYRDDCEARIEVLRQGCENIVAEIVRIDIEEIGPVYDIARLNGTDLTIAAARSAIRRLETYVIKNQVGQRSWYGPQLLLGA